MSRKRLIISVKRSDRMRFTANGQAVTLQAIEDGRGGMMIHLGEPFDTLLMCPPLRNGGQVKYSMYLPEQTNMQTEALPA